MEARRDRRRDPAPGPHPVDPAEWLAGLCASASLQTRRRRSQSGLSGGGWGRHPNAARHDGDLDPEALSSGVLDAFSALHDSLASLLGDPDAVREVVERGGELYRLDRGEVAEACRRRRGREEDAEGPVRGYDGNGCDNANGNDYSYGRGSPGRGYETRTPRDATAEEGRADRERRRDSSNSDGDFSHDAHSGVSRPGAVSVTSNGSMVSAWRHLES